MDRLIPAVVLLVLLGTGVVVSLRRVSHVAERQDFLNEFAEKFMRFVGGGGLDETLYIELTQRVSRMQREVGDHGVMALYRPPFASYGLRNYQILVNMLPEYRGAANDPILQRSQARQYADTIRDVLVRYSGSLQEYEKDVRSDAKNPLVWFREGVRAVLSLPLIVLRELGVLSAGASASLLGSGVIRVGAGLVAFVTLIAALVQILTGWEAVLAIVNGWTRAP